MHVLLKNHKKRSGAALADTSLIMIGYYSEIAWGPMFEFADNGDMKLKKTHNNVSPAPRFRRKKEQQKKCMF